jgi:hypothetical protein
MWGNKGDSQYGMNNSRKLGNLIAEATGCSVFAFDDCVQAQKNGDLPKPGGIGRNDPKPVGHPPLGGNPEKILDKIIDEYGWDN